MNHNCNIGNNFQGHKQKNATVNQETCCHLVQVIQQLCGPNFTPLWPPSRHFVRSCILVSLQAASWDLFSDQSRQTTSKQISACKLQADKNTRTDKMPDWRRSSKYFKGLILLPLLLLIALPGLPFHEKENKWSIKTFN